MLENEEKLDIYEDRLSDYLVQISQHGVSADDSQTVSRLLHAIGDFERIGDHALNLQESAKEIHDKGVQFSASADAELNSLLSALIEIMDYAFKAFSSNDSTLAKSVEPLEETIDHLTENIRLRHIRRLQAGECTVQLGFIHSDLLTNFERVSDHCSNIALSVLEAQNLSLDRHAYLHDLKKDSDFTEALARCMEKYQLPKM
jgi:phosphate:Na+ symporter